MLTFREEKEESNFICISYSNFTEGFQKVFKVSGIQNHENLAEAVG